MDKETFSSYGWIVVTVIIIAIMIAFATPFGKYVVEGVKALLADFNSTATDALDPAQYSSVVNF